MVEVNINTPHLRQTIDIFIEACDLLSSELVDRFENQHTPSVLALDQFLIKATNGEVYDNERSYKKI